MILQPVNDIAKICYLKGLRNVILSPGSRCAPLTLAFNRHGNFNVYTIPDERSAAFMALGMAEKTGTPSVLVCTSGSAVLNYAPAVVEAYYRNVPLLLLTADRPPEWIGQWDGQTIQQQNVFYPHIKKSFQFPDGFTHADSVWLAHRMVNEAINSCRNEAPGPVHINIPLREPFYPEPGERFSFSDNIKIIAEESHPSALPSAAIDKLVEELRQYHRPAVVVGQAPVSKPLLDALSIVSLKLNIPVIGDIISNVHGFAGTIRHCDAFLPTAGESLQPDLLITIGQSVISKNLKLFLRRHSPVAQWHIQAHGPVPDPFQCLSKIVRHDPASLFATIADNGLPSFDPGFQDQWRACDEKVKGRLEQLFRDQPFNEFEAVYRFMKSLSGEAHLHLANSMSVRYANFIGLEPSQHGVSVHANRGTSGIDGSGSTAVGIALASGVPNFYVTGDVSFFYDINAYWHNYLPPNLKILLLNNHGGGIFRLIPGPSQQPELEEYFETHQPRTARRMAAEFGFAYFHSGEGENFNARLIDFMEASGPAIFEVETKREHNQFFFNHFKTKVNT